MSAQDKTSIKTVISSQQGFALITAILACVILFALAMLVITLSTGDLRVSGRTVGEKKALNAAEVGMQTLIQNFDPANLAASAITDGQVEHGADPGSTFTIGTPGDPGTGPVGVRLPGFSPPWGQRVYTVSIVGENTTYNTRVELSTGIGYGPVDLSTMHK
jgi:Tfp pilus assembly protein PilX